MYLKKDGVLFLHYERKNFEKMTGQAYEYRKGSTVTMRSL